MARPYKPLTIPLGKGVDQATVRNAAESDATLSDSKNLDFGLKGGLKGRPGAARTTGFSARSLSSTGVMSSTAITDLATTTYTTPAAILARDGSSERPGIVARGRMFTYDLNNWTDRLGCTQARTARVAEIQEVGTPQALVNSAYQSLATAYDFGPTPNGAAGASSLSLALLSANGSVEARVGLTNAFSGAGNGARCGNFTAVVHVPHGTNNLVLITRNNGARSVTETVLAADARDPLGTGDAPCICCDYNETTFFVAYWTTTAGTYKALKVTTAGTISSTHSHITGLTPRGIWISNGSTATNKTVVAYTGVGITGANSRVLTTSTWTNAAIDLAIGAGPGMASSGQIVVGAVENGEAWMSWLDDDGKWHVAKRLVTAATLQWERVWQGQVPQSFGGVAKEGATFLIQHQPLNVGGRILFGMSVVRGTGARTTLTGTTIVPAATWLIYDLTDMWSGNANGGTAWKLRDPVTVAKGESGRCMGAWGPVAATLSTTGTSYRFSTVDWQVLSYSGQITAASGELQSGTLTGDRGMLGINEVKLDTFQATYYKDSTVIAGSVPRMMARGSAHPVGFPWMEAPSLAITKLAGGGGAQPLGSYTFIALWSWVDDAGQVHYSEPSYPVTVLVDTAGIQRLQIDIGAPHLNERENGAVYTELYMTKANPVASDFHLFAARTAYAGLATGIQSTTYLTIAGTGVPIYTDGNVLEMQIPDASGGCATVGQRCWVSDGRRLFASRLGDNNNREAPSWFVDGTLTLDVPPVAGLVVGLSAMDDKLVVLCERGVYATGGEGPDDLGQGPGFIPLVKAADLGCAHQRSLCGTPKGIFYQAANIAANGEESTGGLYLFDRGMNTQRVSGPAQTDTGVASIGEVCYLPEREQVYWYRGAPISVLDLRTTQWTRWVVAPTSGDSIGTTMAAVSGVLWAVGTEPMKFTRTDGTDLGSANSSFEMMAEVGNINIAGGGLRWGRVRSMSVLGDNTGGNLYDLDQTIVLDDFAQYDAVTLVDVNSNTDPEWPTGRHNTEWRVPQQKCSVVKCTIRGNPGVAIWTAIELEVYTEGGRAPSLMRQ